MGEDSFEYAPAPVMNGVPRSSWFRARKRATNWYRRYVLALVFLDVLAVVAASAATYAKWPQAPSGFAELHDGEVTSEIELRWFFIAAFVWVPLGWLIALWSAGVYDRRYLGIGPDEFKRVLRAGLIIAATVPMAAFAFKRDLSRYTVVTSLVLSVIFVVVLRIAARRVLHAVRRRGGACARMLLVGTLPEALDVYTAVTRNKAAGLVPVGIYLSEGYAAARRQPTPIPLHSGRDVIELVRELGADTIAVCGSASGEPGELRRLAWQLEGTGIDLVVAPQLTDIAGPRVHIRPVEGLPLLHVEEPTLSGLAWLGKNMLDRVVSALGLLVLVPVFVLIAAAIRINSPGPVFFRQRRVGMEGQVFQVWKFRTMYLDAEERLAQLVDLNESDGLLFKIKNDPRVTAIGRFLRRTSLDELPQLINVLKGEMSLVGPRPLPAEDGDFLGDVRRRLLVRPGITGLWQVSGRSDLTWDDAVRLDLYYVDNWSFTTDLEILWRTIGVVLRSKGAY